MVNDSGKKLLFFFFKLQFMAFIFYNNSLLLDQNINQLNFKSLIQSSETLPVGLTRIHYFHMNSSIFLQY